MRLQPFEPITYKTILSQTVSGAALMPYRDFLQQAGGITAERLFTLYQESVGRQLAA